jgi:hypothetical protein
MKTYTIIGPLGDADIQAATPSLAATLYPTVKGWKQHQAVPMLVTCEQTGERFKITPQVSYSAAKVE